MHTAVRRGAQRALIAIYTHTDSTVGTTLDTTFNSRRGDPRHNSQPVTGTQLTHTRGLPITAGAKIPICQEVSGLEHNVGIPGAADSKQILGRVALGRFLGSQLSLLSHRLLFPREHVLLFLVLRTF